MGPVPFFSPQSLDTKSILNTYKTLFTLKVFWSSAISHLIFSNIKLLIFTCMLYWHINSKNAFTKGCTQFVLSTYILFFMTNLPVTLPKNTKYRKDKAIQTFVLCNIKIFFAFWRLMLSQVRAKTEIIINESPLLSKI